MYKSLANITSNQPDFHGFSWIVHGSHGLMFFVRVLPCHFDPPFFRGKQKRPNVIPFLGKEMWMSRT